MDHTDEDPTFVSMNLVYKHKLKLFYVVDWCCRSMVHALSSRGTHNMGVEDGIRCGQRQRTQSIPFATSCWSSQMLKSSVMHGYWYLRWYMRSFQNKIRDNLTTDLNFCTSRLWWCSCSLDHEYWTLFFVCFHLESFNIPMGTNQ